MRKRYMITMDEADHRKLAAEAKLAGKSLGEYLGGFMDPKIRKAVEPEQIKVQSDGRLSKGLGTLPGMDKPVVPGQGIAGGVTQFRPAFKPAPKPGKK